MSYFLVCINKNIYILFHLIYFWSNVCLVWLHFGYTKLGSQILGSVYYVVKSAIMVWEVREVINQGRPDRKVSCWYTGWFYCNPLWWKFEITANAKKMKVPKNYIKLSSQHYAKTKRKNRSQAHYKWRNRSLQSIRHFKAYGKWWHSWVF